MIVLITGGQRSGKSRYAESMTRSLGKGATYVATARPGDEEMQERIEEHRKHRGPEWRTLEADVRIGELNLPPQPVLLDCITLWVTNLFAEHQNDPGSVLPFAREQLDRFLDRDAPTVLVSQELGMGLTPVDGMSRDFVDVHGKLNQYLAERADRVLFMVSGLPVAVKGEEWDTHAAS